MVRQGGGALSFASEAFLADRQMALATVQQRGHAWHAAPVALQADREVAPAAVRKN